MRIVELEIRNVRGIPDLSLKPDGKNIVIWGENGSGKSAVVDALDFLLTGNISRLTGSGTGGISLAQHGCHIDHRPEEAEVTAALVVPGASQAARVTRQMSKPGDLIGDKKALKTLQPFFDLARHGHHVLTRREVLRYITADASTRATEIQALLNISELEQIRRALVTTENSLTREHESSRQALRQAQQQVMEAAGSSAYNQGQILAFVNAQRAMLAGEPIQICEARLLKSGLTAPASRTASKAVSLTLLRQDINSILNAISDESQASVGEDDRQLRETLAQIRVDPQLQRELVRRQLTKMGLDLIDESGNCPLCDREWEPDELRQYLISRLETAERAAEYESKVEEFAQNLVSAAGGLRANLDSVVAKCELAEMPEASLTWLRKWIENLEDLEDILGKALQAYPDDKVPAVSLRRLFAPDDPTTALEQVSAAVEKRYPKATPEQDAWDVLTRMEERLAAFETARVAAAIAAGSKARAVTAREQFEVARDGVLNELYDEISGRFAALYRKLHGPDEGEFTATMRPQGAGLGFEVDFYGRGVHPPHALHSEGHQDSMGLCLYLALAERLTQGKIDLVVLDDVVMSIDTGHRRRLCNLLASEFPGKQFVITTHDRTWATQLRHEGVVNSPGCYEFGNWSLENGPVVSCRGDMWTRIDCEVRLGNIPVASLYLRRGCEQFFEEACDLLWADVRYRSDSRWDLGIFVQAAMGQLKELLGKAKEAAQSWGVAERMSQLTEFDAHRKQVCGRVSHEWWAINSTVHYNRWDTPGKDDFRPVVETFRELTNLFRCPNCEGMLQIVTRDNQPCAVTCHCGAVHWPLTKAG